GRDPAARRMGRGHRIARPRGVAALRDRLLLDAGALLGARAPHPRRLRARGRPDAAGRPRRGGDDLGHLHVRPLARPALAPALRRRRARSHLPRGRDRARRRVRRVRGPAPARRGRSPPRDGPRGLPVLAALPRPALRRDHGGLVIEAVAIVLAVLAGAIYARGVRLSRRRWPWWRTLAFFLGLAALVVALASGIEILASDLFSVHMLQHMLLTIVAAPLLMVGAPVRSLLRGLPPVLRTGLVRPLAGAAAVRGLLHALRNPIVAVAIYVGGLYLWHWPSLYDAAVENEGLHALEHAHFFIGALLFWSVVIDPEPFKGTLPYAARIVYLLLAGAAQNTVLGGILAFSTRVLYAHYE